jgi:6-phosphogluconolactonase
MKDIERIYDSDRSALAMSTARRFFGAIRDLSDSTDKIVVSLSGGRSVQEFFSALRKKADLLSRQNWKKLHFFWTDERLVPPDSGESNYRLASKLFIDHLLSDGLLAEGQIHRFPGERTDAGDALVEYSEELNSVSRGIVHVPIMGVGSDGHVGSLFPHRPELADSSGRFLLVEDSPKPPAGRITISPEVIRESIHPFLFFLGDEKREAYDCFKEEEITYFDCPCKLARSGSRGVCYVVTDLN